MKISILALFIILVIGDDAFAWWGGGGSSRSNSNSGGGSSTSRSGWWRSGSRTPVINNPPTKQNPPPTKTTTNGWWRTGIRTPVKIHNPNYIPVKNPIVQINDAKGWWRTGIRTPVKIHNPNYIPVKNPVVQINDAKVHNPNYIPVKNPVVQINDAKDRYEVISKFEAPNGKPITKMYDAKPFDKKVHDTTIGLGFNLNRKDAQTTFEKVLPGVDFKNVKAGKQSITEDQAQKLFKNDVDNIYAPAVRQKIGSSIFDKLPENVKTALINAEFRGGNKELGPKTVALIKAGDWKKVSTEYLNHNEYKDTVNSKMTGVRERMNWNAKQFDTMAEINQ